MIRKLSVVLAASLLLTACTAEQSAAQEPPISADAESPEVSGTEPEASETSAEAPESQPAELPEPEFVFGMVGEMAAMLRYDECVQERMMFDAFDAAYSEDGALLQGYALGSAEQLEHYRMLFSETAARIGSEAAEEEALQAAELLNAFAIYAAAHPEEEYIYLVFCGQNPQDKSKYSSYLGTDIAFDGTNIELVPRYEITDAEAYADEKTPAVEPPQYLWVAAAPRTFFSAGADDS